MLRIKELNLTCMINDSERITEKLGHGEGRSTHIMVLVLLADVILFHSQLRSQDRLNF